MVRRLTIKEQRDLIKAIPHSRKISVRKYCETCQQRGDGIGDILKKIGSVLGPIAKELGPTVMKELVIPFIKQKITQPPAQPAGKGLTLPGGKGLTLPGRGLRLAGQTGRGGRTKTVQPHLLKY